MTMKPSTLAAVGQLIARCPALAPAQEELSRAVEMICAAYRGGHKLLACGNGGSAADAEHIVGELMKGFLLPRKLPPEMHAKFKEACPQDAQAAEYLYENLQGALPALSLGNQIALNSAFANDQAPDLCFAQQVLGIGRAGDVLLAISTSGNSANVLYAVQTARAMGIQTIGLTGETGGKLKPLSDVCICAPSRETFRIQEYHLPIYHMLCIAVENEFFSADEPSAG